MRPEEQQKGWLPRFGRHAEVSQARDAIGSALWLLLLLERIVDPELANRGEVPIRAAELSRLLGVSERQARRELQRLRKAGWVELRNTGRGFKIRLVDQPAIGNLVP